MFKSTTVYHLCQSNSETIIIMKFCCFLHCAVFCFITACTFTVINVIDEDVISETFKTKGSTRIFQTENTTDVYCRSIYACAGMCLSDSQCCVASYSKAASTCRIDTSEKCCAETETLDEWRFIQRNSYHDCTINLKEVAHNKPAEQSSVYRSGFAASKAVDGNVNTFMHTNLEQSPYWVVDLVKTYQIKRIEIFNRNEGIEATGERLRDLDIMIVSFHNETQICAHYVGPAQLGEHLFFKCGHVENARYVKLRLTGSNYLHVAEVKVYAVNDSST